MFRLGDITIVYATWVPLGLALLALWGAWRGLRAKRRLWRPPAALLALAALICLGAASAGMPIVATNAQLQALPSYQWLSVLRLGVNALGDASPQWFTPSATTCAIVGGDIGSQVPSADGGCFNASFFARRADARQWSAIPDGTTDNTAHLNACLAAMSPGGTCYAPGRFYFAGTLVVPLGATLDCGATMGYEQAQWNTAPVMLFNMAQAINIKAGGHGYKIAHCDFIPKGVTYPIATLTGNFGAGTIIDDQGYYNGVVHDIVAVGQDQIFHVTGPRSTYYNIMGMGLGNTEGVMRWDVGNTDSGSLGNIEIADGPWSNNSALCEPGNGLHVGGAPLGASGVFIWGKAVIYGMNGIALDAANSVIADTLWLDQLPACGAANGIGFKVSSVGAPLHANKVYIDENHIGGIVAAGGSPNWIGSLIIAMNSTGSADALQLGISGGNNGVLQGNSLEIDQAGGYAVDAMVANAGLKYNAITLTAANIHGGAYPMFGAAAGMTPSVCPISCNFWYSSIVGPASGNNIFDNAKYQIGSGGNNITAGQGLPVVNTSSGLGTGSAAFHAGSSDAAGFLTLSPVGAASAAGSVQVTSNFLGTTSLNCQWGYSNAFGATAWSNAAYAPTVQYSSNNQFTVTWNNNTPALTGGASYTLNYHCAR